MQQSSMPKGLKWFGIITIILTIIYFIIFGMMPQEEDPVLEDGGAGASLVDPAYSGLLRAWSPLNEPADNRYSDVKTELRQIRFSDLISLENDDVSSVSCYHPDDNNHAYNNTLGILSVSLPRGL